MKPAYYNEIDPFAAQWLRNLIVAGHIAPGDVDERSIEDVHPSDLKPYTQCHFFAGVGVWSHALRRAGWPDDRPVWTGSCPCQPFSQAGEGAGFDDQRHLWPHFFHLIEQRRPAAIFGEQVASRDANPWIDLVQDDLEGLGYGVGAVPFPSAGVGAPHIRDRLYWMAHSDGARHIPRAFAGIHRSQKSPRSRNGELERHSATVRMADHNQHRFTEVPVDRGHNAEHYLEPCSQLGGMGHSNGKYSGRLSGASDTAQGEACLWDGRYMSGTPSAICGVEHPRQHDDPSQEAATRAGHPQANRSTDQSGRPSIPSFRLADAKHDGRPGPQGHQAESCGDRKDIGIPDRGHPVLEGQPAAGPTNGLWSAADWLLCRDGKWRPVEPGTFPLAHGSAARVGRLRAYGNAINAVQAQIFIEAAMSCMP
ncbi:DNA cytosine methyltransferase [Comamonas testosteroni]|uniref:DNA cytosine methyltransferase n=1 Tax=Comamonas testosteroni TaxID=285 RepID=UPI0028EEEB5D|nr:DNA cytosine methyltransferase [Comamonas testosteroni]